MFKKKKLTQKHLTKQVKKAVELGKTPIIGVAVTLADGAKVETCGEVIALLCNAIGEKSAVEWHTKYMDKFNKLTQKCYQELEDLVKTAKELKEGE